MVKRLQNFVQLSAQEMVTLGTGHYLCWGGGESWGGPGLFFLRKGYLTMVGRGSLCVNKF